MIDHRIFSQFLATRKACTDTRQIEVGSIFFALKGANFDGNLFAEKAIELGCSLAVVDNPDFAKHSQTILVNDALTALQDLAKAYRETFTIPFLGITGSNGKTTTKELVRDVLAQKFEVFATKGNLNNHIGVPLTLLSMPASTQFAVIEMGANHQGEIDSYCRYAKPQYGLITNIGKAHLEGFGGVEGVKKGKKELFDYVHKNGELVFVNQDQANLISISTGMQAEYYGMNCQKFKLAITEESPLLILELSIEKEHFEIATQMTGAYNANNISAAISVGLFFGVEPAKIVHAISAYSPDNNRSQVTATEKNAVIMDAYNANPSSMEHAIRNLQKQKNLEPFFIIGDMLELGEEGPSEHLSIIKLAFELGLKGILVGPIFQGVAGNFPYETFANRAEAITWLQNHPLTNKTILLKASRGMRLEELLPYL
jgi:UDP-N-acetylmuramoyl-tripeptide--D-alanyl-D-alanine ligase